eukprot:402121-Alexandrium_andersonii.AAC.1
MCLRKLSLLPRRARSLLTRSSHARAHERAHECTRADTQTRRHAHAHAHAHATRTHAQSHTHTHTTPPFILGGAWPVPPAASCARRNSSFAAPPSLQCRVAVRPASPPRGVLAPGHWASRGVRPPRHRASTAQCPAASGSFA